MICGRWNKLANLKELRGQALEARYLYNTGQITYKEAEEMIMPYKKAFDEKAKEIAEKYNQKPKKLRISDFIKFGR